MKYVEYKEDLLEFKQTVRSLENNPEVNDLQMIGYSKEILTLVEAAEDLLFLGKSEVQPIKVHQLTRIYKLAKIFIEIIIKAWPLIRILLKLLRGR